MTADYRFGPAATAASRIIHGDRDGATWTFFHCMTQAERDDFDRALVAAKHPLAARASSQEQRFGAYVTELVEAPQSVPRRLE